MKKNNYQNMSQKTSPTVIKIPKTILYTTLTVSMASLVVSIITLSLTLLNPIKTNKQLDKITKGLDNLTRMWQSGGINYGNNNSLSEDKNIGNSETIDTNIPDVNDSRINGEVVAIATELLKLSQDEKIIEAINDLDTSSLSVKGLTSNVKIASVTSAYNKLSNLVNDNRYITKAFFGTKEENFISSPEVEVSKTYQPTTEQWYKLAQTSEAVQRSQMHQDEFTKEYVVTLSVVIKDGDRELGVLGVQVNLSKMK